MLPLPPLFVWRGQLCGGQLEHSWKSVHVLLATVVVNIPIGWHLGLHAAIKKGRPRGCQGHLFFRRGKGYAMSRNFSLDIGVDRQNGSLRLRTFYMCLVDLRNLYTYTCWRYWKRHISECAARLPMVGRLEIKRGNRSADPMTHPMGLVHLPTFSWFFMVNVGKYTIINAMGFGEQIILAFVCYLKALNYFDFLKLTREKLWLLWDVSTWGMCVCFFSSIVLRFSNTMLWICTYTHTTNVFVLSNLTSFLLGNWAWFMCGNVEA